LDLDTSVFSLNFLRRLGLESRKWSVSLSFDAVAITSNFNLLRFFDCFNDLVFGSVELLDLVTIEERLNRDGMLFFKG